MMAWRVRVRVKVRVKVRVGVRVGVRGRVLVRWRWAVTAWRDRVG